MAEQEKQEITCEDCVYFDICTDYYTPADRCRSFKNKNLFVELPFALGTTVFVIVTCKEIPKFHDDDYLAGTGAVECPYETTDVCCYEECIDENRLVVESYFSEYWYDSIDEELNLKFGGYDTWFYRKESDIGKTVFTNREDADAELKKKDE